jgi:uncharacterized protein
MSEAARNHESSQSPQWKPLSALDRRVIGVLVEKAKTTPEQYPLTLNSLVTGCNQKNNRDPQMQVQPEDVEEAIERLRAFGALVEVQGSGRVPKYRHMMYDWLGVNKVELGVMTELLLRGAQTEGELRGRAARMDPIPDLTALRPIVESLKSKGLVISLTSEGRGHVLSHALYLPHELESLRTRFRDDAGAGAAIAQPPRVAAQVAAPASPQQPARSPAAIASVAERSEHSARERDSLRAEISQLRRELEELVDRIRRTEQGLREMRESLGG